MDSVKAFVDNARKSYAGGLETNPACIDALLREFSELPEEDQDKVIEEIWLRIRAGDADMAQLQQTVIERLIQGAARLEPQQRIETLAGVYRIMLEGQGRMASST